MLGGRWTVDGDGMGWMALPWNTLRESQEDKGPESSWSSMQSVSVPLVPLVGMLANRMSCKEPFSLTCICSGRNPANLFRQSKEDNTLWSGLVGHKRTRAPCSQKTMDEPADERRREVNGRREEKKKAIYECSLFLSFIIPLFFLEHAMATGRMDTSTLALTLSHTQSRSEGKTPPNEMA